ncbi:MAG: tRNA (adenosine(37)-N6)-threonylcarbamoyltransferase complex dimerization subunit type 1 TsaB [Rhodocyclaceae bacterium]|nr:tRNA (adenosine(37)-N6)-threonylcarbamoyltransferase complex dimerization subunit type 1 TsaB [Rhodocyclaceae bacterium]
MKLLGIETSGEAVSIAVWRDGVVDLRRVGGGATPSETLIPDIMALLRAHALTLAGLDAIALGVGPGMFTGLRVGCSVAQGLALAAERPIIPLCSLAVIAAGQRAERVLVATDARMGEVYVAAYQRRGALPVAVVPPTCTPPDKVVIPPGEWFGAGNAFAADATRPVADAARLTGCDPDARAEAGALVALAAAQGLDAAIDPAQVAPLYVRDKVAQTVAERLAQGGKA